MPTVQEVVIGQEVPEAQVQAREEVIHVPRIIQQERTQQAHVEVPAQVPVSRVQEEVAHVPEIIVQKQAQHQTEQEVQVPVPMVQEEVMHVPKVIQQKRVQHQQVELEVQGPVQTTQKKSFIVRKPCSRRVSSFSR